MSMVGPPPVSPCVDKLMIGDTGNYYDVAKLKSEMPYAITTYQNEDEYKFELNVCKAVACPGADVTGGVPTHHLAMLYLSSRMLPSPTPPSCAPLPLLLSLDTEIAVCQTSSTSQKQWSLGDVKMANLEVAVPEEVCSRAQRLRPGVVHTRRRVCATSSLALLSRTTVANRATTETFV